MKVMGLRTGYLRTGRHRVAHRGTGCRLRVRVTIQRGSGTATVRSVDGTGGGGEAGRRETMALIDDDGEEAGAVAGRIFGDVGANAHKWYVNG